MKKLTLDGLRNAKHVLKETVKGVVLTNEDNASLESYLVREKSSWEMDQEEIETKFECIRFALESALDKESGEFEFQKWNFIRDMVKNMFPDCNLIKNFKDSLSEKEDPYCALVTHNVGLSEKKIQEMKDQGYVPVRKRIMLFHYERKLLMDGRVIPYFRMELVNNVDVKRVA